MKRLSCLLLLSLPCGAGSLLAAGFDLATPARVQVAVVDSTERPVAGARVTLHVTGGGNGTDTADLTPPRSFSVRSDARGMAAFSVDRPVGVHEGMPLTFPVGRLEVEHAGYRQALPLGSLPVPERLPLWSGAEIFRRVTLEPVRPTRIRFQRPDGSPFAGLEFQLVDPPDENASPLFADARGEYVSPGARPTARVVIGSLRYPLPNAAVTVIRVPERALASARTARRIEGRVVLADGRPAERWRLGWNVTVWPSIENGRVTSEALQSRAAQILPSDGRFQIETADEWLLVESPEGIPFRYPINPQAWPAGEIRQVTLTIPPVERVHRGQLILESTPFSRRPAPGPPSPMRLSVRSVADRLPWRVSWPAGGAAASIRADAEGHYEIPFYAGTDVAWFAEDGFPENRAADPARDARVVLTPFRRFPLLDLPEVKRVQVSIEDEAGRNLLPRLGGNFRFSFEVFPGQRHAAHVARDAGTLHVFVPVDAAQLTVVSGQAAILQLLQTVELTSAADQTVRIRVPDSAVPRPVTGVVLDPDGRPLPALRVNAVAIAPELPGGRAWFDLTTYTDAQGRFELTAAPATGELSIGRADFSPLPGWVGPPSFSPDNRNLTIRLSAGGTVRVLPQDTPGGPSYRFTLERIENGAVNGGAEPARDTASGAFVRAGLRPGRYQIKRYDLEQMQTGTAQVIGEIEIEAGRETTVDLAALAPIPSGTASPGITTIDATVTLDGRPFAGATVVIVSAPGAPTLSRGDVSDSRGRVRLTGVAGPAVTLQARVPGRWTGATPVDLKPGAAVTIALRPESEVR